MRLLTYNILEGGVGRIDPLAEVIRLAEADVAILQETWDAELFHKLADRLHMDRFLAENPKNKSGAVGLLSRLPIHQAINHAPLDPRLTRSAFTAQIETPMTQPSASGTQHLSLLGLQLHSKETLADEAIRLVEIAAVLDVAAGLPRPHFMAGDFNSHHPDQRIDLSRVPDARGRISGQNDLIPREVVSRILAAGYLDAHALHRTPEEFGESLSTAHPAMRVDYFFITPDLAPRVKSCDIFKPEIARFASDHFPVLLEISPPPA